MADLQTRALLPIYPPCFSLGPSDRPSRTTSKANDSGINHSQRVIQASCLQAMVQLQPAHCRYPRYCPPAATNHLPGAG
ncbi:hypothetical protein GQ55_2G375600 [Panicum hallii var. hallii]|uniref:Uncharacterized protein n=1 Tax=Panicum hallii var. hallii TaxID=1504633 RepID=A0A2T7EWL0_9POAL|nr:hypothetical protein GQ55_2G375600 [Panicum hallii var. hallii]